MENKLKYISCHVIYELIVAVTDPYIRIAHFSRPDIAVVKFFNFLDMKHKALSLHSIDWRNQPFFVLFLENQSDKSTQ